MLWHAIDSDRNAPENTTMYEMGYEHESITISKHIPTTITCHTQCTVCVDA